MKLLSSRNTVVSIEWVEIRTPYYSLKTSINQDKVSKYGNLSWIKESDVELGFRRDFVGDNVVLLGIKVRSGSDVLSPEPLEIKLSVTPKAGPALAFTSLNIMKEVYEKAMKYYNQIMLSDERSERLATSVDYPGPTIQTRLDYIGYYASIPAWLYPVVVSDLELTPSYTFLTLAKIGEEYLVLAGLSHESVTHIHPELKIRVFTGIESREVDFTWVLVAGLGEDPYSLIEKVFEKTSLILNFKLRKMKRVPNFMRGLGWCSWNALNLRDLSDENVMSIIKSLAGKGLPIYFVLIDDGWQQEKEESLTLPTGEEIKLRILESLNPEPTKFKKGFRTFIEELSKIGVKHVGLWHTLNLHWGGLSDGAAEELGIKTFRSFIQPGLVPPPSFSEYFKTYSRLYEKLRSDGFTFVKVDNQWVGEVLYIGTESSGKAVAKILDALQQAGLDSGLEILNCMSMSNGCLLNYWDSNVVRASIDYVPFWREGAKLHNYFCVYNSLLVSQIAYPDYDMFVSYDDATLIHLVFHVLSSGPLYITDRDPEKTRVDLLKKAILPNGEVVRPDEPALPTLDILFKNPLKDPVLLKVFTRIRDKVIFGVGNVNESKTLIKDRISLRQTRYNPTSDEYVAYRVLTGEHYVLKNPSDYVEIELNELEADIVLLTPIRNGISVIGLRDVIIPPYPVEELRHDLVRVKIPGKLIYYKDGELITEDVKSEDLIKL